MLRRRYTTESAVDKKNRSKRAAHPTTTAWTPFPDQATLPELSQDQANIQDQAARLSDPRFQSRQRQMMARQIGRKQGNRHLAGVMEMMNSAVEKTPKKPSIRPVAAAVEAQTDALRNRVENDQEPAPAEAGSEPTVPLERPPQVEILISETSQPEQDRSLEQMWQTHREQNEQIEPEPLISDDPEADTKSILEKGWQAAQERIALSKLPSEIVAEPGEATAGDKSHLNSPAPENSEPGSEITTGLVEPAQVEAAPPASPTAESQPPNISRPMDQETRLLSQEETQQPGSGQETATTGAGTEIPTKGEAGAANKKPSQNTPDGVAFPQTPVTNRPPTINEDLPQTQPNRRPSAANSSAAKIGRPLPEPDIQRNPLSDMLEWAKGILTGLESDTAGYEGDLQGEAGGKSSDLQSESETKSEEVRSEGEAKSEEVQGESETKRDELQAESAAKSDELQAGGQTKQAELRSEGQAQSDAVKNQAAAAAAALGDDWTTVAGQAAVATGEVRNQVEGEITAVREEAQAVAGDVENQWAAAQAESGSKWQDFQSEKDQLQSELTGETQQVVDAYQPQETPCGEFRQAGQAASNLGGLLRRGAALGVQLQAKTAGVLKAIDQTQDQFSQYSNGAWQGVTERAGQAAILKI